MKNIFIPTTIVDGFFEEPDDIRNFALQQKFEQYGNYNYPGKRTEPLKKISPILHNTISNKLFSLFFNNPIIEWNIEMMFQLIDSKYGCGWIHRDPSIFTAIIYLNKVKHKNIGTSLYEKNDPFIDPSRWDIDGDLDGKIWDVNSYKEKTDDPEKRQKFNSNFHEVLNVQGLYNRALIFDSHLYHGAHNFVGYDDNDARLTIICFTHDIINRGQLYPIQRIAKSATTIL